MEVHHHPDLHHKKKTFKELFIEFIMIFLAVTLGFIAENIREAIGDHKQEKQYIQSLISNLKEDTATMHIVIGENEEKIETLTKLMQLANADYSKAENVNKLYSYRFKVGYYSIFKSNDATMSQLKTTGLQLIKKDHAADSIAIYDAKLKIVYSVEDVYLKATNSVLEATQQLLNLSIVRDTTYFDKSKGLKNAMMPLYEDNKASLPRFFNKIDFEIGATNLYILNIKRVLPLAERLIAYLKKEYDLN